MTIEFLPWDVTPSSPIYYYQENFERAGEVFGAVVAVFIGQAAVDLIWHG